MRKFLAICLCFIMLFSMETIVSFSDEAETVTHNTMVFLPENFVLPEHYITYDNKGNPITNGWAPYNTTLDAYPTNGTNTNGVSYWGSMGGIYPHFLCTLKGAWYAEQPAVAKFYIDTPGTYYIWSLAFCNKTAPGEFRHTKIGFDGGYDARNFTTSSLEDPTHNNRGEITAGFGWRKGKDAHELAKGWHELNIKAPITMAGSNMIVITTDNTLVFDEDTTFEDVRPYTDITAPVWAGDITSEYVSHTSIALNLPDVTETNIAEVNYYVNGEKAELTPGRNVLQNLKPLNNMTVKAEALDKYGSKATVLEKTISISSVDSSAFSFCTSSGEPITDINGLSGLTDIKTKVTINSKDSSSPWIGLGIGIYEKSTGRMVDFMWTDKQITNQAATVLSDALSLSADVRAQLSQYKFCAYVWQKTTGSIYSSPVVAAITLGGE